MAEPAHLLRADANRILIGRKAKHKDYAYNVLTLKKLGDKGEPARPKAATVTGTGIPPAEGFPNSEAGTAAIPSVGPKARSRSRHNSPTNLHDDCRGKNNARRPHAISGRSSATAGQRPGGNVENRPVLISLCANLAA